SPTLDPVAHERGSGGTPMPLLEVIALTADDARAAEDGGADRLEVVADMAADGLTPDPDVVEAVRKATTLPLRVMLRARAGFLDSSGHIDTASTGKLAADTAPLPWTFHRAVDHAADPGRAWDAVRDLGGRLDTVLTAGSPRGVDAGVDVLVRRAAGGAGQAGMIMAGGGLRRKHVAVLAAAGVTAFHVGTAVRPDGAWDAPVDPALVREWRALVSAATGW